MIEKEIFGLIAVALALCRMGTYFWSIFKGSTQPHLFSWLIWGVLMVVAGYAQYVEGAESGSWVTLLGGVSCLTIAFISIWKGEKNITRSDWMFFIAALLTIPIWYFTDDPFWAVLLICAIDFVAYVPTIRKTWVNPYSEPPFSTFLAALRWAPAMLAIAEYNFVTLAYPALLFVLDMSLVLLIIFRRRAAVPA